MLKSQAWLSPLPHLSSVTSHFLTWWGWGEILPSYLELVGEVWASVRLCWGSKSLPSPGGCPLPATPLHLARKDWEPASTLPVGVSQPVFCNYVLRPFAPLGERAV